MKSNQVVTFSRFGSLVSFGVAYVEGAITIDTANLADAVIREAIVHGIKQKISDRAAIGRDPETGRSASPQEKFDAMRETAERLANGGPWNAVGGEGGATKRGILFTALCELFPAKTADDIREFLAGKSKADQAKLRKTERVAAKIAEIQARDGDGDLGDDMLGELGDE